MVRRVVYGLGGALAFALGVVLLIKVDGSFFAGFFLCFAGGAFAISSLLKDPAKTSTLTREAGDVARTVEAMSGVEFEEHVADLMRASGYVVTMTATTGDFGVDLVAVRNGKRLAVQCKRQAKPVGSAAVQQVVAGAVMHKCTETMVVSNQLFTSAAQRLAMQHGCLLVGVTGLTRMLRAAR